MYKNLEAEMARNSVTSEAIADAINKTYNTTRQKITGKKDFTITEAIKIKRSLFPDFSMDYLFDQNVSEETK